MTFAIDRVIDGCDQLLRALLSPPSPLRPAPRPVDTAPPLTDAERRHAAALMRINHVGEVCAQGLYAGQALATDNEKLREDFREAAREEGDHLAWTAARLDELGSRPSLLNPAWYAGSFAIGWLAGRAGDAVSLGFVVETERQVEEHLARHLETLPANDLASRAIVAAMRHDEIEHGAKALNAGARALPPIVGGAMRGFARIMTTTAYWI
jgi:ubiquinone biosynthesis monooxygenase Coq7